MKSLHVDDFNHDDWAPHYDKNVIDENDPIRAGYRDLLDWVIQESKINQYKTVLELGSGTGNLTERINECKRILCVDISTAMEEIAATKTSHLTNREFRKSDILAVFEQEIGTFDAVISTYAIHHLLDSEKSVLFTNIYRVLNKGGIAVFGDLMFENEPVKRRIIQQFRESDQESIALNIDKEFFWDIETSLPELEELGFETSTKQFSCLSFGITAKKFSI